MPDLPESDGRSQAGRRKRKSKSKPTKPAENRKKKLKKRYASAREDAQLAGLIPTTPDGAVRNERSSSVDPLDGLPELVRQALRENWATPAHAKPAIIAALLRPFFNNVKILTKDGAIVEMPASPKTLNELARTILALDQTQYERENPEAAGKAKGPLLNGVPTSGVMAVTVSLESNKLAVKVLRETIEKEIGGGVTGIPPMIEQVPDSPPRFDGEVETGAAASDGTYENE